jgi:hypothetical protein
MLLRGISSTFTLKMLHPTLICHVGHVPGQTSALPSSSNPLSPKTTKELSRLPTKMQNITLEPSILHNQMAPF